MGYYATVAEIRAYCAGSVTLPADDEKLEEVIARGEADVDSLIGPIPYLDNGRKLDLALLPAAKQNAVSRATCAAVEFRMAQGEESFIGASDGTTGISVQGLNLSFEDPPLPPGRKVVRELAGWGLMRRTLMASPEA